MTRMVRHGCVSILLVGLVFGFGCAKDPAVAKVEYLKSGNRFFDQKQYQEAIVQYRNALQQDPRFGEARFKLAQSYEIVGDGPRAFAEYIRAADAMPDNLAAQLKAGDYLLLAGQFEEARKRAERAIKIDHRSASALVLLGNSLSGLKEFESALKQLEEAAGLDPSSASAYASLGALQLARGKRADAEAAFRKAVETNPKLAAAHNALGNYLWASGRFDEAEQSFKQALALDPHGMLPHRALATLYFVTGRAPLAEPHMKALADSESAQAGPLKLGLADYYVALNRPDDAIKVLEAAAQQKEGFGAARTRLASIEFFRRDPARAHRDIDEVLSKEPKNVPALLVKARFLAAERKYEEAVKLALAAIAVDRSSIQAHYLLGTLYRASNRPAEAVDEFNEVLKMNPRAVAAQVQLSELNLAKGFAQPALQFAQDAAKALPRDPAVQLNYAKALAANGDTTRADVIVKALIKYFPKIAAVHSAAGGIALARRDSAGARTAFLRARALDPNDVDALVGLVMLDMAAGKTEDAMTRVEEQRKRMPDDARLLLLSGQVQLAAGNLERAEELFSATIRRDPSSLQAYGALAQLYARQGKLPQARASFEEMARKQPNSVGALTLIALLYEAEGNHAEARKRYEHIIQMDSTAPVAANNLAFMYAHDGGNLDVALQLAQAAKAKLPNLATVDDTLGWVYYRKELPKLAIPAFERAVRKAPKNATFQYHLGLAYAKAGDKARAKSAMEAAIKLKPTLGDSPDVRQALAVR